jgi:predicted nucleotidyltransferase
MARMGAQLIKGPVTGPHDIGPPSPDSPVCGGRGIEYPCLVTEEVDQALECLCRAGALGSRRLRAVWLFGSHARGEPGPESDLDLALLCDPPLGLERTRLMDQIGRELGRDVDVIDLATASPTLAWEILTSGRLVVENDELGTEAFLRRTRYAAEDEARRNRMIVLAQAPRVGSRRS